MEARLGSSQMPGALVSEFSGRSATDGGRDGGEGWVCQTCTEYRYPVYASTDDLQPSTYIGTFQPFIAVLSCPVPSHAWLLLTRLASWVTGGNTYRGHLNANELPAELPAFPVPNGQRYQCF